MIRNHRRRIAFIIILAIAVIVGGTVALNLYLQNKSFKKYETINTIKTSGTTDSKYYKFGNCMLVYSNDGIAYIEDDTTMWNQAFEMKTPLIDICDDTMAIADQKTTTVYIYNKDGQLGKIETVYPIIDLEVSKQGVVAAITQDDETNLIEILDKNGESIATGQTYLTGDGCPVDIAISSDGTKLATSYIYIDGGESKCKVVFYNYSEVGKNEVGRIVGGFNLGDDVICTKLEFIDNNTVVSFENDGFTIYDMEQRPSVRKKVEEEANIKSIFFNKDYIGTVVENDNYDQPNLIKVYDTNGNEKGERATDFTYTDISISGNSVVLNNDQNIFIMTVSGNKRYQNNMAEGIVKIIPTEKNNQLYIINHEYNINKIKFE